MKRTRFALSAFFGTFTAAAQVVGLSYGGRPAAKEFDPIPVRCICPQELAELRAEGARLTSGLLPPAARAVLGQLPAATISTARAELPSHDAFGYQEKPADYGYNVFAHLAAKCRPATVTQPPAHDEIAPSWSPLEAADNLLGLTKPQREEVAPAWSPLEEKVADIFDYLPGPVEAPAPQTQPQQPSSRRQVERPAAPAQPVISSRRQTANADYGYGVWQGFDGHGYPYVDRSLNRGAIHAVTRPIGGGGNLAAARGPLGGTGNLGAAAGSIGSQSALASQAPLGTSGPLSGSGPLSSHGFLSGVGPLTGTGPLSGIGHLSGSGNLRGNGSLTGQGHLNGGGILGGGGGPIGGGSDAPLGDGASLPLPGPAGDVAPFHSPTQDKLERDLADLRKGLDATQLVAKSLTGAEQASPTTAPDYADDSAVIDEAMRINLANDGLHSGTCPIIESMAAKVAQQAQCHRGKVAPSTCPKQDEAIETGVAVDSVDRELCPLAADADPFLVDTADAADTAIRNDSEAMVAPETVDYEYDDTYGIYDDACQPYQVDGDGQASAGDVIVQHPEIGSVCRDEAQQLGSRAAALADGCFGQRPFVGSFDEGCFDETFASADAPVAAAPAPITSGAADDDAGPVEAPPVEADAVKTIHDDNYGVLDAAFEDYGLYGYDEFDGFGYDLYGYDGYDGYAAPSERSPAETATPAVDADTDCDAQGDCDAETRTDTEADNANLLGDECLDSIGRFVPEDLLLHGPEYDCFHARTTADDGPVEAPSPQATATDALRHETMELAQQAVGVMVEVVRGLQDELRGIAEQLWPASSTAADHVAVEAPRTVELEKADFAPATGSEYGPQPEPGHEHLRPMPKELPSFVFPAEFDLGI